jgi:hypothetical protein
VQVLMSLGRVQPVQVSVSLGSRVRSVQMSVSRGRVWPALVLVFLGKVRPVPASRGRAPPAVLFRQSWLRLIPLRALHCLRMMQPGRGLL